MFIARREFQLDLTFKELDEFVHEIQSSLKDDRFPENYTVNILKDQIACCGVYPMGLAFEIEGPDKQGIENVDIQLYSKFIENCERKHIEYHESQPLDILE
jgi:hypothetical protein